MRVTTKTKQSLHQLQALSISCQPLKSEIKSQLAHGSTTLTLILLNRNLSIGGGHLSSPNAVSKQKTFYFDHVFPTTTSQQTIFKKAALPLVENVFQGYNCTLFAYGQTGSGKTHTIEGEIGDKGMRALLNSIANDDDNNHDNHEFSIKISYVEIYNEQVNDLLHPTKKI